MLYQCWEFVNEHNSFYANLILAAVLHTNLFPLCLSVSEMWLYKFWQFQALLEGFFLIMMAMR